MRHEAAGDEPASVMRGTHRTVMAAASNKVMVRDLPTAGFPRSRRLDPHAIFLIDTCSTASISAFEAPDFRGKRGEMAPT